MKKAICLFCAFIILFSLVGCQKTKVPYTEDWESLSVDSYANLAELGTVTYSDKEWDKIVKDAVSCFSLVYEKNSKTYSAGDSDFSISEWNKLHPFQYFRRNKNDAVKYEIVYFSKSKALFLTFDINCTICYACELDLVAQKDLDKVEIGKTTLADVCKKIDPSKNGYDEGSVTTKYSEYGDFRTRHYVDDGYIYDIYYKVDNSLGADTLRKALVVSEIIKVAVY